MHTFRFNRRFIKTFETEQQAFEHALAYDDNVQAIVEKRVNGQWMEFVETYDGNGKWEGNAQ